MLLNTTSPHIQGSHTTTHGTQLYGNTKALAQEAIYVQGCPALGQERKELTSIPYCEFRWFCMNTNLDSEARGWAPDAVTTSCPAQISRVFQSRTAALRLNRDAAACCWGSPLLLASTAAECTLCPADAATRSLSANHHSAASCAVGQPSFSRKLRSLEFLLSGAVEGKSDVARSVHSSCHAEDGGPRVRLVQ